MRPRKPPEGTKSIRGKTQTKAHAHQAPRSLPVLPSTPISRSQNETLVSGVQVMPQALPATLCSNTWVVGQAPTAHPPDRTGGLWEHGPSSVSIYTFCLQFYCQGLSATTTVYNISDWFKTNDSRPWCLFPLKTEYQNHKTKSIQVSRCFSLPSPWDRKVLPVVSFTS